MLIDDELLDEVSFRAVRNERLRMNFNLHDSLDAKAQRLLNALEPGTIVPIHRHCHTAETYILLRGKIKILLYDDKGNITATHLLIPRNGVYGVHIPAGQWHSLEVLANNSVIFEVKDGPYTPLAEEDLLQLTDK